MQCMTPEVLFSINAAEFIEEFKMMSSCPLHLTATTLLGRLSVFMEIFDLHITLKLKTLISEYVQKNLGFSEFTLTLCDVMLPAPLGISWKLSD